MEEAEVVVMVDRGSLEMNECVVSISFIYSMRQRACHQLFNMTEMLSATMTLDGSGCFFNATMTLDGLGSSCSSCSTFVVCTKLYTYLFWDHEAFQKSLCALLEIIQPTQRKEFITLRFSFVQG